MPRALALCTMLHKHLLVLLAVLCLALSLQAQAPAEEGPTRYAPVQFSLWTPIGTNGQASYETRNSFSINLLYGEHGALTGLEAGLVNGNLYDVLGVQAAGLANLNAGQLRGLGAAGLVNVAGYGQHGVLASGLFNYAIGNSSGLNAAGGASLVAGNFNGLLAGGLLTATSGELVGAQVGGLGAYAGGPVTGALVGGLGTFTGGPITGAQVGGLGNVLPARITGIQVAGLFNLATDVNGLQVGGVFNLAQNVRGLQIGLINMARRVDGAAIGVLNLQADGGMRGYELLGSNALMGQAAFRSGNPRSYGLIALGGSVRNDATVWAVGFGLGTHFGVTQGLRPGFDMLLYKLNEDKLWSGGLSLLQTNRLTLGIPLGKRWQLVGGVALDIVLSNPGQLEGFLPHAFFDETYGNYNRSAPYRLRMAISPLVGLRLNTREPAATATR